MSSKFLRVGALLLPILPLLAQVASANQIPDSRLIRVSKNQDAFLEGSHYNSIQDAINSLNADPAEAVTILVYPGAYDSVIIDRPNLNIIGVSLDRSIISSTALNTPAITINIPNDNTIFQNAEMVFENISLRSLEDSAIEIKRWDGSHGLVINNSELLGKSSVISYSGNGTTTYDPEYLQINNSELVLTGNVDNATNYLLDIVGVGRTRINNVLFASQDTPQNTSFDSLFPLFTVPNVIMKYVTFETGMDRAMQDGNHAVIAMSYSRESGFLWGDTADFLNTRFSWEGAWQDQVSYVVGDLVEFSGNSYICIKEHGSNQAGGLIPTNIVYWSLFASGGAGGQGFNWQGDWVAGTYDTNDVVKYSDGASYICVANPTTSATPGSSSDWEVLVFGSTSNIVGSAGDSVSFGTNSEAIGSQSVAIGYDADARKSRGIAIGRSAKSGYTSNSESNDSIAIGYSADALAREDIAIGYQAKTENVYGQGYKIALGSYSYARDNSAVAIGYSADAIAQNGVAIGRHAEVEKFEGISIGADSKVSSDQGISIGTHSEAGNGSGGPSGAYAIAVGHYSDAGTKDAIAIGRSTQATAEGAIAIGRTSQATHSASAAIGLDSKTVVGSEIVLGAGWHTVHIPGQMRFSAKTDENVDNIVYSPSRGSATSLLNSNSGYLLAEKDGIYTQLTSHADPDEFANGGIENRFSSIEDDKKKPGKPLKPKNSFDDLDVSIPWSFHHKVDVIGKGAVVDIAKAMKWIELKMMEEKGDEGVIFHEYDLPDSESITCEEYCLLRFDQIREVFNPNYWVKVTLLNGALPTDAWEQVEILEPEYRTATKKVLDWETASVVEVEVSELTGNSVPTGIYRKQLTEGYEFFDGELYRAPTDAELLRNEELVNGLLPEWIVKRAPGNHDSMRSVVASLRKKMSQ